MPEKRKHIPVNILPEGSCRGIMMMRDSFNGPPNFEEVERSHRDGGYTFIIQEEGSTFIEVDFQTYHLQAPTILVIHPDQVHRLINFDHALVSTCIITKENLRSEHHSLLESLVPLNPLTVGEGTLSVLLETFNLCMKLTERKTDKLYHVILKESCNTLVVLFASQFLSNASPTDQQDRFGLISKEFKATLEKNFKNIKAPGDYARLLNISTSYLNECVKTATGRPATAHIQQRVMLEAKRMLYHSGWSIKEIAVELGYEDFSYFTRLFVKVTGMSPAVFRKSNRE